ncbi:MAG: hypothetical protein PVH25_15020 [Burkholderiales bacterium]|jgi:hypothetical protein
MKPELVPQVAARATRSVLFVLMLLVSFSSFAADDGPFITPDEVVAKLKPKLSLSDQQASELNAALTDLSKQLGTLIAQLRIEENRQLSGCCGGRGFQRSLVRNVFPGRLVARQRRY